MRIVFTGGPSSGKTLVKDIEDSIDEKINYLFSSQD